MPSAATIRPRLICSSSSSVRTLSGLLFSEEASNTVQREVKNTSSANSTTTTANRRTIGVLTAGLRARSEISSSSATSTRLATIEEPP